MRAVALTSDLLDFTAARLGKGISVTPAELDIHASVAELLDDLRVAYPAHAIAHLCEGDGTCAADHHRVTQVVGNLVSNAAAYGHLDRQITVTTRGGELPTVVVHNEGTPIPTEKLAGLFEPMTRGTEAAGKARSIGLGLYIVREIARAHGGTAGVVSTLAGGTTFTVTFARAMPP